MTTKRYGKSSSALLNQKKTFFEENKVHVRNQLDIAKEYAKQPKRENCMNCTSKLQEDVDFIKDSIGYKLCQNCGHLNGANQDTDSFCRALYTENDGEKYAKNYDTKDVESYDYRTTSIYLPKAEFLQTTLISNGIGPNQLSYLDFGCGSGFFVAALKKLGLKNIKGTEVSKAQVDFGNTMMNDSLLTVHDMEKTISLLETTTANVVSMIGVLEHVQQPHLILNAIKKNRNIEYFYISVPTFSLATFIETLSPNVFHRQLSCAHTHLYTKESLQYLAKKYDFDITAEWWFGSDMVDLYRHVTVNLEKQQTSSHLLDHWRSKFVSLIDSLQLELDKQEYSSEVHMLFKKNG